MQWVYIPMSCCFYSHSTCRETRFWDTKWLLPRWIKSRELDLLPGCLAPKPMRNVWPSWERPECRRCDKEQPLCQLGPPTQCFWHVWTRCQYLTLQRLTSKLLVSLERSEDLATVESYFYTATEVDGLQKKWLQLLYSLYLYPLNMILKLLPPRSGDYFPTSRAWHSMPVLSQDLKRQSWVSSCVPCS